MSAKLLLAGYFGCGNLGDDAILLGFLEAIKPLSIQATVMSGSPELTNRNYGVPAIPRRDTNILVGALHDCDALVFPGGSIFQDSTSVFSVKYYADLVRQAKKAGKKVIMLAQGVGPLTSFFGKQMAARAFSSADLITVRDPASAAALKQLGVRQVPRITADFAFLLPKPAAAENTSGFQVGDMRTVGISARPLARNKTKEVVQIFGGLTRLLFEANLMPVLIEMDRELDGPLILEIEKTQGGKVPDVRKLQTPGQLQARMSRMEAVIAMRLHAGLLAGAAGTLPFMVSYDPKVNALCTAFGLPAPLSFGQLTAPRLFENFMAFYKDKDRHLRQIQSRLPGLREMALANVEALVECLPGISPPAYNEART